MFCFWGRFNGCHGCVLGMRYHCLDWLGVFPFLFFLLETRVRFFLMCISFTLLMIPMRILFSFLDDLFEGWKFLMKCIEFERNLDVIFRDAIREI